ncbi:hypothetical protein [Desulfovibrio gilichinskyi]|uniref:Uncharacterized protein n=1 Tax=Desulfovibrio gilichinskyi TaxID=1519643 RepID=A0A1X7C399_9BACT|nr:hypothetical protein [Desulfovibrio gilichinskyi]SME89264.1 hypothetical protein SAMN06295933_0262 [Desulfovibrio gilichinskyi]
MEYSEVNELAAIEEELREAKCEVNIYKSALNRLLSVDNLSTRMIAKEALMEGKR